MGWNFLFVAGTALLPQTYRPSERFKVQAAYNFETDDQTWLAAVMETARGVWGRGGPMHGAIYDASDVASFRALNVHIDGFTGPALEHVVKGPAHLTPALIARSFRSSLASTSALANGKSVDPSSRNR